MAECFISPVFDTAAEQDDVFIPGRFQGIYQDESTYEHGPSGSLGDLLSWARSRARVVVVHLPGPDGVTQ